MCSCLSRTEIHFQAHAVVMIIAQKMYTIPLWFLFGVLVVEFFPSSAMAIEYYVATDGKDENLGTISDPFRTIHAALDEFLKQRLQGTLPEGEVKIFLRQGIYELTKSICIDSRFSGSEEYPFTVSAYPGEEVRITGGSSVSPSSFSAVSDEEIRERIIERGARDEVLELDLPREGIPITSLGHRERTGLHIPPAPAPSELIFAGKPMQVARWPNHGYEKVDKIVRSGSAPAFHSPLSNHHEIHSGPAYVPGVFKYRGDRPEQWLKASEVWLEGYWVYDWADDCMLISSIDPPNKLITLSAPHAYGMGGKLGEGDRFIALNLLEEIDQPGEYYIDVYTGMLYFYPPEHLRDQRIVVSLLGTPLIVLSQASYVAIQGLIFEDARSNGIEIVGGDRNTIDGCTFQNLGGWAVKVDGGQQHTVRSCNIHDVGRGGIELVGGDQRSLTPAGHRAVNNHIHHYSRLAKTYQWAVALRGVGNVASNNLIHNAPHGAIDYRGNYHQIQFNEIHHVCLNTNDAGAIQTDRDFSIRGNKIRNNFIHHIGGKTSQGNILGVFMVYLDSAASGDTFSGNIFYHGGDRNMIFINGGRDVLVDNNIFVDGGAPVELTSEGLRYHRHTLEIAWKRLLEKVDHTQPPWSTAFPKLADYPSDPDKLGIPEGNSITNNLFYRTNEIAMNFTEGVPESIVRVEDNLYLEEDPFVDLASGNFRLKDIDAIRTRIPGFKKIPIEQIGLYQDEHLEALSKE